MSDGPIDPVTPVVVERRPWGRAPGRWGHLGFALPLGALLWATSYPGIDLVVFVLAASLVAVLAIVWFVRFVAWFRSCHRRRDGRWAIAPIMLMAVALAVSLHLPLRARFGLAKEDFDNFARAANAAGPSEDWTLLQPPDRIGSYGIVRAYQAGRNVILFEATGKGLDNAGFAYLPEGPDATLTNVHFEDPHFRSLGGKWYAWTAGEEWGD